MSEPPERCKEYPPNQLSQLSKKNILSSCNVCKKVMRESNLERHMLIHNKPCRICNEKCLSSKQRNNHEKKCRQKIRTTHFEEDFQTSLQRESAINNRFNIFTLEPINDVDYSTAIVKNLKTVKQILAGLLRRYSAMKFYIIFEALLRKEIHGNTQEFGFYSNTLTILQNSDIDELLRICGEKINESIESFLRRGSGWILEKFINITLNVTEFRPCAGGTYLELPPVLKSKKSLLNIQNKDEKCIIWNIIAALHPCKSINHPSRTTSYRQYFDSINIENISFPTPISDIPKLEKNNKLRINVYGYDEDPEKPKEQILNTGIFPRYISPYNYEKTINLLFISNEYKQHYVLIKSLDGLIRNKNKNPYTKHCERCLQGFSRKYLLDKHIIDCKQFKIQRTVMPKETNIVFKNIKYQVECPVIIVADFESVLVPVIPSQQSSNSKKPNKTMIVNEHEASGYAYKVVSNVLPHLTKPVKVKRHKGCVDTFISDIYSEYEEIKHIFKDPVPLIITTEDTQTYLNSKQCHICEETLDWGDENNYVVRDHCHFTGKFRGAAHNLCNLQLRIPTKIPVIFHGLRNYDGHLIIKGLANAVRSPGSCDKGKFVNKLSDIRVLPHTIEKFTSISTKEFTFIDSCQHLTGSLSKLVDDLRNKGLNNFKHLISEYPDPEIRRNLFKKGLYPYNYVSSFERFNEPIPPLKDFQNDITDTTPSVESYNELKETCCQLNISTIGELHDHYVKLDTILLADVIANYRSMALNEYKLDPLHYGTAPSFSYDAMLKYTKAKPELLHDPDMYLFMERGIRGGISVVSHRLATANNKYLKDYDETKPKTSLFYTDCCNLYGYAMSQPLPYSDFRWLTEEEIDNLDVENYDAEKDEGMILEVDLHYPQHLHDSHSDYPLAPEKLTITQDMLSRHTQDFISTHGVKYHKQSRLAPNLCDKQKYIVHIKSLQQYISLGLVLKRIHRVISFHQRAWLKPYIDFNTEKRQKATSDHEKDFFKLLINSIFGKMMENVRQYKDVRLITNGRQHRLYTSKPQFKKFQIISDDLVTVELIKPEIKLNKAIYCGMSILDISKHRMYDFHYNYIKKNFPDAKLCFTDTDSLLYLLNTNDIYESLEKIKDQLDLSKYPSNHPLHDTSHKDIPGFFKDETRGIPPKQYCGLRSKSYSLLIEDDEEALALYGMKKYKNFKKQKLATAGIRSSVHKKLSHDKFLKVLRENSCFDITQYTINSKKHNLYTLKKTRTGLSALDIKRYILDDGVSTIPYGHFRIGH